MKLSFIGLEYAIYIISQSLVYVKNKFLYYSV